MSKLFFDDLINLKAIDDHIKKIAKSPDEKLEMWDLVDQIVHHKIMDTVLENLPTHHHEEFLDIYHQNPHNEILVFEYLHKKTGEDYKKIIKDRVKQLEIELKEIFEISKKT